MAGKQIEAAHQEQKDWKCSPRITAGHEFDDLLQSSAKTPTRETGLPPAMRCGLAVLAGRSQMPGGLTEDHFKDCASSRFHPTQATAEPSGQPGLPARPGSTRGSSHRSNNPIQDL